MSAFASPAATPAPTPERAPAPPPRPAAFRYKWLLLVVLLAAIAAGAWLLRPRKEQQKAAVQTVVHTYKVAPVLFERTIRAAGTTSARNYANIVAPVMRGPDAGRALVLISLAKSGAVVKKGDLLAEIDPQGIKDHADDVHALVVQAEGDVRKRRADQAIERDSLRQTLTQAKAAWDKAVLDYKTTPIRMPIDQELLKLSVDEAEATYKELQQEVKIQEAKHAAEIRILELTRDRHVRHRDRHRADVERFKIYAPMSGLVVMQSIWRGGDMGQVQVGDQLSPGQPFMKIVDTTTMQLEAMVNQVESEEIRIGQQAQVQFDAFPDLEMKGRVYSISALAVSGWRQNYFIRTVPVNIAIKSSDPRLIPDLSASANVEIETRGNILAVPQEAVFGDTGKPVVFIKTGDVFHERPVELGPKNNTQVAVLTGLREGEEIALQRPPAEKR
jgi:multidrug efflux pump subunit AcrA (membrane-fusion protein)